MEVNAEIRCWIEDAHARTRSLVGALRDEELSFPYDYIQTPVLWEIGHVAWFQEYWFLVENLGQSFAMEDATERFDSRVVPHGRRWHLELPSREQVMDWLAQVEERSLRAFDAGKVEGDALEALVLSILHQDMHNEAWTYQNQTLGYGRPQTRKELEGRPGFDAACAESARAESARGDAGLFAQGDCAQGDFAQGDCAREGDLEGDAMFPAGRISLGACSDGGFHFDNEQPPVELGYGAFALSKRLVTQSEFRAFVEEGGYERDEYWSADGRAWRRESASLMPCYWRKTGAGDYERRHFDEWVPVEAELPMHHVNWFEAEAWCRFAGRRLPSEIEWEVAACCGREKKKRYPWGNEVHPDGRANLSWFSTDVMTAGRLPGGRTAQGVDQLFGEAWEWTASDFEPYPGFVPGTRGRFYREYSEPAFGTCKVLRGGSWATTTRLLSMSHRNFFEPGRNDIISGFRSCSLD